MSVGASPRTDANATAAALAPDQARRPRVTLHYAQSLDGRIATRNGSARWISGEEATRFAHELRAMHDAVLIGSGTALRDDPLLTVRHVPGKQPLRVVLDGRARLPKGAKLAQDKTTGTVVATLDADRLEADVEAWQLPAADDGHGVALGALLARLDDRGVRSVLVEGGARVLTSFFRERLFDRVIVTVAPLVLGAGVEAVGDLGVERLDQALRLATRDVFRLGDDVMIELVPAP